MPKVPLTPAGIAQLQTDLYALPDPELFVEADAAYTDFVAWVDSKIELIPAQLTWLGDIDEMFIKLLGIKTAIALKNRLDLSLTMASGSGSGKWFQDKDTIAPKWVGTGEIVATGTLEFETGYL